MPIDLELFRWKINNLPDFSSNDIPPIGEHKTLFSDGSAFFVKSRLLTIAGSACVHCEQNGVAKTITAKILPTPDHTPFRAEVYAILLCLQYSYRCTICLDCAAAKQTFDYLLVMRVLGRSPKVNDHWDLWLLVWNQIVARPKYSISTRKVKAHVDLHLIHDNELRWISKANDCADRAAKKVVFTFLGNRFRIFEKKDKDFTDNVQRLSDFYSFWAKVNNECWVKGKQQSSGGDCNPCHELLHNPARCVPLSCQIPDPVFEGTVFGKIFIRRVLDYFHGLHWDFDAENVSILELYFDFAIWTQSYVPILLDMGAKGPKGPVKTFVLKDQSTLADIQDMKLSAQSVTWHRVIKWLIGVWNDCPFIDGAIDVRSLHRYGYSIPHLGLVGRPAFRTGLQVHRALWGYFHTSNATLRSLSRVWHVPPLASHGGA